MSKVISFSISDKYLEKLRTLYPSLTDNLAAKQFLTDGLESSLGSNLDGSLDDSLDGKLKSLIESSLSSSLDDTLDDVLDDKLKTIIETSLDDVLDERLDAVMGKLLTSLSERLSMLEARLDDSLDGGLDEMESLLRMQREASITSLIPTIGENPDMEPVATVEIANTVESVDDTVEAVTDTVESVTDTVEAVEPISSIEPVQPAIGPVRGEGDSISEPCKGMNAAEAFRYATTKGVKVSEKTLSNWVKLKQIPITDKGDKVSEYLVLRGKLYYPID